jgi:hypothetical protein
MVPKIMLNYAVVKDATMELFREEYVEDMVQRPNRNFVILRTGVQI